MGLLPTAMRLRYGFSHNADFAILSTASRGAKKRVSPQLQQTTTSNLARWNTPLAPGSRSGPKWPTASVVVTRRSLLPQFEHGATCISPPDAGRPGRKPVGAPQAPVGARNAAYASTRI